MKSIPWITFCLQLSHLIANWLQISGKSDRFWLCFFVEIILKTKTTLSIKNGRQISPETIASVESIAVLQRRHPCRLTLCKNTANCVILFIISLFEDSFPTNYIIRMKGKPTIKTVYPALNGAPMVDNRTRFVLHRKRWRVHKREFGSPSQVVRTQNSTCVCLFDSELSFFAEFVTSCNNCKYVVVGNAMGYTC